MKKFSLKTVLFLSLVTAFCLFLSDSSFAQVKVTPTIDRTANYNIGDGAEFAAFDGTHVWIANQFSNTVTKINSSTGTVAGNFATTGNPLGIDYDGRNIWVSRYASGDVVKMDTATGIVTASVKVNDGPGFLMAKGGFIWVVNRLTNTVQKISATDRPEVLATYNVGKKPAMMAFDGANVWVANSQSHSVTKIPLDTGLAVNYPLTGKGAFGVTFDGTNIWVSNFFSGDIVKLSNRGLELASYKVGDGLAGMYYANGHMWVVSNGDNLVYRVRLSDGTTVSSYEVSQSPYGLVFDGQKLWTQASGAGKTSVITPSPVDVLN